MGIRTLISPFAVASHGEVLTKFSFLLFHIILLELFSFLFGLEFFSPGSDSNFEFIISISSFHWGLEYILSYLLRILVLLGFKVLLALCLWAVEGCGVYIQGLFEGNLFWCVCMSIIFWSELNTTGFLIIRINCRFSTSSLHLLHLPILITF